MDPQLYKKLKQKKALQPSFFLQAQLKGTYNGKEKNPRLRMFLSHRLNENIMHVPIRNNRTQNLAVEFSLHNIKQLSDDTRLCFHVYADQPNKIGIELTNNQGVAQVRLEELLSRENQSIRFKLPMPFARGLNKTIVELYIQDVALKNVVMSPISRYELLPQNYSYINSQISNNINRKMKDIDRFVASQQYLKGVHTTAMPSTSGYFIGWSWILNDFNRKVDPKFFAAALEVVQQRDYLREFENDMTDLEYSANLLMQVLSVYSTSFLYAADRRNVGLKGENDKYVPVEIFNNALNQLTGDCEDLAAPIVSFGQYLVDHDVIQEDEWETMRQIAEMYVAGTALAGVQSAAATDKITNKPPGFHEVAVFIPLPMAEKTLMANNYLSEPLQEFEAWAFELPVLVGEGTGIVPPTKYPRVPQNYQARVRLETHNKYLTLPVLKKPMPYVSGMKSSFYLHLVSVMTPTLYKKYNIPMFDFLLTVPNSNKYGVRHDDVWSSDYTNMQFEMHPVGVPTNEQLEVAKYMLNFIEPLRAPQHNNPRQMDSQFLNEMDNIKTEFSGSTNNAVRVDYVLSQRATTLKMAEYFHQVCKKEDSKVVAFDYKLEQLSNDIANVFVEFYCE